MSNGDWQAINDKIEAIDKEYCNKLQENEEKIRRLSVKTEKTKSKLESMEEKYKFLERQLKKLTKSDQDQSEVEMGYDILEKADNHKFDKITESNNEEKTEHPKSETTIHTETEYECKICSNKFKSQNNMKKRDIKFHIKRNKQSKPLQM